MSRVLIIGAGMGGLTAGCMLARSGHNVTIFEAHHTPGGYTAGFRRQGFYFESGTLSFESSAQVFRIMKGLGVYEQIRFVPQHYRFLFEGLDFQPRDYEDFKRAMLDRFPGDRESLERYFAAVDPLVRVMSPMMSGGRPSPASLLSMVRLYLKYRNQTITDFSGRFFSRDSALFRLFKSFGYPDMSAWILGGAIITIFQDYWTVADGMQSWADALAARFSELGGELSLGSRVEKIVTRDGAAVGVEVGGKFHPADWVISAADYKKTFLDWLDNPKLIPGSRLEKIRANAVSEGIFTVYLGLDIPVGELRDRLKLPHVLCFDEQPGADIRKPDDPDFFQKVSVNLCSPSLLNPAAAPAGQSSLMIQASCPYRWQNNWGGGDRGEYRRLKERVMRTLIAKANRFIPGLEERIVLADAATPLTYERFTGNSDGATSAWSWNPNKKFYPSFIRAYVDTPVRRLLIGSCWATQIGGVPGALSAARACAKKIDR